MRLHILIGILVLTSTTHPIWAEPKGEILSYGLYTRTIPDRRVRTPQVPSGFTRIGMGIPALLAQTNGVPATTGTCFGFVYEIRDLAETNGTVIDVVKVVTHPAIVKPSGQLSTTFSFVEKALVEDGRARNWTGYGFDHPYELVPGAWEFEIRLQGKSLMRKKFNVYAKGGNS